jgi:TRAP-type uncharacterized transport system fused permease subunit
MPAFLVPFVFVEKPELLLMGTPLQTLVAAATVLFGTYFLAAAVAGYLIVEIGSGIYRALVLLCALAIIIPENISTIVGVIVGIGLIVFALLKKRRLAAAAAAS